MPGFLAVLPFQFAVLCIPGPMHSVEFVSSTVRHQK